MSTTEAKRTDNGEIEDLDVIVVGAGFAGLYLLDRLRSMGMAVQVFEAGGGLGGVWYWNCYPGARVDSPGPIYQYSRDDLWRGWQFSELYPSWQDIDHHLRPTRKSQSVTMPTQNRQWILNARPPDRLTGEEFRWKVAPIPRPAEGQVLVRNLIVALGLPKGPNQSAPFGLHYFGGCGSPQSPKSTRLAQTARGPSATLARRANLGGFPVRRGSL
jgi:cyclohexanone monooxygenase